MVELAQNAADAAARQGRTGLLLLRLVEPSGGDHGALVVASTGEPLDAAGARALASLRASAKRQAIPADGPDPAAHPAVGRFGVGFTAVLGLTDAPRVLSRHGGVAFSRERTRAAVAALASPGLDAEVAARDGQVPALRLPWPDDQAPPPGYDTAVVLPLRDAAAAAGARAALEAVDDVLLLALPALEEVLVEVPGAAPRTLREVERRWYVLRRSGPLRGGDLTGLGVEEGARAAANGWSCAWALPRSRVGGLLAGASEGARLPGAVLAPTPTDEALPWPAVLVLDTPLDPGRRVLAQAPATATVLREAAHAYADLLAERAGEGEDVLDLVPVGLPAGAVDADLRATLADALTTAAVLRPVGGGAPLRPGSAVVLDGDLGDDTTTLDALAPLVGGLVSAPRRHRALLLSLGATVLTLGDLVEAMPLRQEPGEWAARARAIAPATADPGAREQLALLPVPLAGGRAVRGARGLLVAADPSLGEALATLADRGLRVVDPAAVGDQVVVDLLTTLGARPATARAVLDDPAVAAAVADDDGGDDEAAETLAGAVLTLARRAVDDGDLRPGDLPWAGEVLLPAAGGEVLPAAGLVLPGSVAARLLDPAEVAEVHPDLLERWGAPTLLALGVASTLGVVRLGDVDADDPPDALLDADGGEQWLDLAVPEESSSRVLAEVVIVRDLDLVLPERRGEAVALVGSDPVLRSAVVDSVRPGGGGDAVVSHAAWWLGRETGSTGRADPDAPAGLREVLGAAPPEVASADPTLRAALGTVLRWSQVPPDAWQRVLDHLGDLSDASPLPALPDLLAMWGALAESVLPGAADSVSTGATDLEPPDRLVALGPGGPVVAQAVDVVVVDAPRWRQVVALGPQVVVPSRLAVALADALDVDLSSERGAGASVRGGGVERDVPALVVAALPGCPATWQEHEALTLDVAGHAEVVGWWVDEDGTLHADGPAALASALAERAGAWGRRHVLAAVLLALADGDEASAASVLADEAAG